MKLSLQAPAKVNLGLTILGKRPDGYHDVVTRMQKIDLCDEVHLELSGEPGIFFQSTDRELPHGDGNLAVRAARVFLEGCGSAHSRGVSIRLVKKIPVSAGLGGGSSDAGAVLRGLNTLLGTPLSQEALVELARPLGADVPFFASGISAATATGIGDILHQEAALSAYWFLLINPGLSVSTKWVFDNYALTSATKNSTLLGSQIIGDDGSAIDSLENDLEAVTIARYPVVAEIKKSLADCGADGVAMSGSGATVFGLFKKSGQDEMSLKAKMQQFTELYGSRVYVAGVYAGA